jgi:hypothetical protein
VHYRLYFFDAKQRIHQVVELEATHDQAAIAAAERNFNERQNSRKAELWRGGRIVRTFQR